MTKQKMHKVSLKIKEQRLETIYSEKINDYQYKQTFWVVLAILLISLIQTANYSYKKSCTQTIIAAFQALVALIALVTRYKRKMLAIYLTKFLIVYSISSILYLLKINHGEEIQQLQIRALGFFTLLMDWYIKRWTLKAFIFIASQTIFIYFYWDSSMYFEMLNQISFEVFVTLMFYWSEHAKKQNFLETNYKIQQLSLHHDIINKLIPCSMIILQFQSKSEYKILYANQSCLETFKIEDISQLDQILTNVTVDNEASMNKEKVVNLIEESYEQLYSQKSMNLPHKRKDTIKEVDIIDILTSEKLFHHKNMYFNAKYSHCYFQNELSALIFLSDETIQRKNEYLKQMNIYKDKLLARISHDLKTPLNCILSISQNFKNCLSNISSFNNDMDIISKNSQLLMHMINDILDYSQIKMQKLKLNCQLFNVKNAILDIFRLVQTQADSQNIQLIADVNSSLEIFNDENRFKQIILNFIQNSIQYTRSGFIKVKCQPVDLTNELQVSIIDTGKGMDQETINKLFSKIGTFNKTHLNVDGVGLGLIMSKKLIRLIGNKSSIQVDSKLQQGSKFTFNINTNLKLKQISNLKIAQTMISAYQTRATQSLSSNQLERNDSPCNISPNVNIEQQFNEGQESLEFNSDMQNQIDENLSRIQVMNEFKTNSFQPSLNEETKKIKVMIVDDIYYNIIALKAYLKNFTNLEISEFIFAEDAFLEIQKTQYDIIFSDIQMPIMDGIQFVTKVRQLKDKIKQPTIFMISADNQQTHQERLKDLDIQSFIQKPILSQQSFNNIVSSSLLKL
ncbi:hypothetical protein ABPG74_000891 [Tetrahymena malaccensis]